MRTVPRSGGSVKQGHTQELVPSMAAVEKDTVRYPILPTNKNDPKWGHFYWVHRIEP